MNHKQASTLIAACGADVTVLLRGQPGVGKSALLSNLARQMPDYHVAYIDVTNLDLGDVGMPVVDKERMITHYAPNARFGIAPGQTRPVLLMLDELGKASKPVLNMLLPVILERRLGDVSLPEGSIVFATTNLDTDGVGDNIPAHAYNRMTVVDFSNPTADEWIAWARENNVPPEVTTFAREFPQVFDRYDTTSDPQNPYIFNPKRGQTRAFCSPRSLTKAGHLIAARAALGDALLPALIGTVGEAAARDMEALVHLADRLPSTEQIVADPTRCRLPEGAAAQFFLAFKLSRQAAPTNLEALMTYVKRWPSQEAQVLFVTEIASSTDKVGMAMRVNGFIAFCAACGKFF